MNQNQRRHVIVTWLILLLHLDFQYVSATHMRGGSISWRQLNSSTVEINYWFAWRDDFRENGHDHCTEETHANHDNLRFGQDLKYKADGDMSYTTVYDISYKCTDHNPDFGWVAGVGAFNYTSPTQDFTISLETCCWIRLMNYGPPRNIRLTTGIDLTEFSSSGEINNSPVAYTVPLQRVQQQCNALIKIAASDPDGDDVRCRWASNNERKDDCDEVCGPLPAPIVLFRRDCVISFEPVDLAPGYYAVTLMVEDFMTTSSRKALSKIPIQFLLEVFTSDRSCQRPFFISPTPANGLCIAKPAGQPMQMTIAARNSDATRPIAEIASVGTPLGMTKTPIATVPLSPTDYFVDLNWTPPADYTGNHQMCFIAQDHGGSEDTQHYASEQTCVTINVGGSPLRVVPEQSFPSPEQMVSKNTFMWEIMFDNDITLPRLSAFITFLNSTGHPLHTVSVQDSSESTHVRVSPIHTNALSFETHEFELEANTNYTIRIHEGVAEANRRGCGHLLSEFVEWNFTTEDYRQLPGNIQNPDEVRLSVATPECRSSYMIIYISRALVGDVDPSSIYLNDASCTGAYHNATHYSIGTAYGMCNTQVHEINSIEGSDRSNHFENVVHIPSQPYSNGSIITRKHHIEIHVSCILANQRPIFAEFDPNVTTIVYHEAGYGEFEFSLYMCTDDTFAEKYRARDFPVEVDLRQRLFFESRLYDTGDTGVHLQSCRATPTANPLDLIYYEFLQDGCPVDDTVLVHESPNSKKARFSIEAFAFLGHFIGATVFVHCDMSVCMLSEPTCTQTCEATSNDHDDVILSDIPIAKRDVSITLPTSMSYTNTDGPIRVQAGLQGPSDNQRHSVTKQQFSLASLIEIPMVTLSLCILLFLLIVLLRVHSIVCQRGNKRPEYMIRDPVTLDISALSKA